MTTPFVLPTLQELFNTGWQHFVVDNAPLSIHGKHQCAYRGPNGAKCLIGLVMPDETYSEEFDMYALSLATLIDREVLKLPFGQPSISYLTAQARLHDNLRHNDSPSYRRKEYLRFAHEHNLTVPT